ncbi:unnamed protein product [Chrysoparadoxa australica]
MVAMLEDTGERLTFLGSITPDVLQHRDELSKFVGDEISRIIQEQRQLGARYAELIAQRSALKELANKSRYKEVQAEIQEVSRALRDSTTNVCRNLKDNPNISGNLQKIQRERSELIDLLSATCREMCATGTFTSLVNVVEEDRLSQSRQSELVRREKAATATVRRLETELKAERGKHARQVSTHSSSMAELKQTLTEVKRTSSTNVKYSRKDHAAKVSSLLRLHRQHERELENKVNELEAQKQVELTVHQETMDFLEGKRGQLGDDLDAWEEKYATEHGGLEAEYEALVIEREEMLLNLEDLKKRRAVELELDDQRRAEKERLIQMERDQVELGKRQDRAAGQIQRIFKRFMKHVAENGGGKKGKKGKKGKDKKGKKGKK